MPDKDKLIIFDMDNTLIHSHMDFNLIKSESSRLLREAGLTPDEYLPVTQTLAFFKQQGLLNAVLEEHIWTRIVEIEYAGLAEAKAEPQVEVALERLAPHAHLAVLTNTDEQAARAQLMYLGLSHWFDFIMGRGGAPELKPAPGGMLALLSAYPYLTASDALAVGDAIIDMRAAQAAGLRFCAYNRSRAENWQNTGFLPECQLCGWDESSAGILLALLEGKKVG